MVFKLTLRLLCLVWVILERMENEGEKSGEKMMFLVVWLRVEKRRDYGGVHKFSLLPLQNTISPKLRENRSEKLTKIFEQNCPHFLFSFFFFFTTSTGRNKCGLPTIFFLNLNMIMCMDPWYTIVPYSVLFFGRFFFLFFKIYFLFFIGHDFSLLINFGWLLFFFFGCLPFFFLLIEHYFNKYI